MEEKNKDEQNKNFMYILVAKDLRSEAIKPNRTTVHSKKEVIDKITLSLKSNFYLLKVEKNNLDAFIDKWNFDNIDIDFILNSEAARFIKKKYDKSFEPLLESIIQVG